MPISIGPTASFGPPASRFLSIEECQALIRRVSAFAEGGGETTIFLNSTWMGNLRWARNSIISSGDVRDNNINILRPWGDANTNQLDDRHLRFALRRAERNGGGVPYLTAPPGQHPPSAEDSALFNDPYGHPNIWSGTTYRQTAEERAELMRTLVRPAEAAGMLSAGYIQVSAIGKASMDQTRLWYYPYTQAQYSVTVRDPQGTGSGWAGVSGTHWDRIDAQKLSAIALDKCLRSRNPVRLEPGRYTTILEPQAVGDLVQLVFSGTSLSREYAEYGDPEYKATDPRYRSDSFNPFNAGKGYSKIGSAVIDGRLTVRTDYNDPDLGFPPFDQWCVYHPATWIERGVLKELSYGRAYAVKKLGKNTGGLPLFGTEWSGAYRMSPAGTPTSMDEMIATTTRGVLVTRFSGVVAPPLDLRSLLTTGYTRDGTWLIENGKISHPIKNFRFTSSPFAMLNNVEQIGTAQPIFSPGMPMVVPALKVRDFNFTGLSDAV